MTRPNAILDAARRLMMEEGAAAVTLRGVARAADMSPGHLNYYFANLDVLMDALLDRVIRPYLEAFDALRDAHRQDPEGGLAAVLEYVLDDLSTPETTKFFPELWALANHDERVREKMQRLYDRYLHVLEELIREMRPELDGSNVKELALFICASIEGQTVFVGYERSYTEHRRALRTIAVKSMLAAVERHGCTPAEYCYSG